MTEEIINALHAVDNKEFPSKDYINALEKMEKLSEEYKKLKGIEPPQGWQDTKSKPSKIYAKWHALFKNNCLSPFPKEKEKKTVFIKWMDMSTLVDQGDTESELHLTVMTPEMLLTDYLFYTYNAGQDEYSNIPENWGRGIASLYKPYYYAFDQYELETVDDSLLRKLKEKDDFGYQWFRATIWLNSESAEASISDGMLRGRLSFSASKMQSKSIVMRVANKVAQQELLDALKAIDEFPDISRFDTNVSPYVCKVMGNIDSKSFVKVYNVGQANCIYVHLYLKGQAEEKKFFFDVGRPFDVLNPQKGTWFANPDLGDNTVMSKNLLHISCCKPDVIFLSHWHTDHVLGSLLLGRYVYEDTSSCIWIAPMPNEYVLKMYRRLIKFLIIKKKIFFVDSKNVKKGVVASNGDCILYQGQGKNSNDLNVTSLMLKMKNTLLAGDCMYQYWPHNLQQNINNIEQMVIPHHGSKLKPKDEAVIKNTNKLKREMAVICTGENKYGHPNQTHIDELTQTLKFSTVKNLKNMKMQAYVKMDIV